MMDAADIPDSFLEASLDALKMILAAEGLTSEARDPQLRYAQRIVSAYHDYLIAIDQVAGELRPFIAQRQRDHLRVRRLRLAR